MRLEKALRDQQQAGQALEKRNATAKGEIEDLQKRIKTAEKEIEDLQKQNDKINFEGYDGRLWDVEQGLDEVGEQYKDLKDNVVTQENLKDFGEDIKQDIGKRILGDD
ncbi:uncharacterized protein FTJAE_5025 [Fusarium tjaetaba]|uniref:Uncharacterized protein n=1 Tax=Fusarium tjaetaba TaxID=1567544 RepID=A0A8H5RTQ8_9HYPO|nr:uncharacterized protein FTJAE_5025 [Fusarium tjaetaba]KAF5638954.1 hypothetical protein FTJAE_5025 [Fusarium tjaetaba]